MKRVFNRIFLICFIIIMALSCSACDFIADLDKQQTGNVENTNTNYNNKGYSSSGDLPSSIELSSKVDILSSGTATREEEPSTLKQAYQEVKGSAVAIFITYTEGSATKSAAGSGTIVDISVDGDNGSNVFYVLTCFHVIGVEGATVQVCVPDDKGKNYGDATYNQNYIFNGTIGGVDNQNVIDKTQPVTLVGGDKESDVAVLRLYIANNTIASTIKKAKIIDGEKYKVEVPDEVFLLGNPTGSLSGTFTQGYISYVFRESYTEDIGYMTLYQLNVDAWHGSSGGGLYNLYGELIGILNSGSDDNSGINFAIPFKITDSASTDNGFVNIMKQLIGTCTNENYGYVSGRRVKFGFTVSPNNEGMPYISSVVSGSLSDSQGLKENDIVTSVKVNNGSVTAITAYNQFTNIIENLNIGDTVVLTVKRTSYNWGRGTTTVTASITLPVYQFYFCNTKTEN